MRCLWICCWSFGFCHGGCHCPCKPLSSSVYNIQTTVAEGSNQEALLLSGLKLKLITLNCHNLVHLPWFSWPPDVVFVVVYFGLSPVPSAFHRSQGVLQLAHNPSGVLQRRVCGGLWHPAPDAPERGFGGGAKEAGHQLCTAERWEGIQVEEDNELQTANKTDRGHGNQVESPTQMMADKSPRRQNWLTLLANKAHQSEKRKRFWWQHCIRSHGHFRSYKQPEARYRAPAALLTLESGPLSLHRLCPPPHRWGVGSEFTEIQYQFYLTLHPHLSSAL